MGPFERIGLGASGRQRARPSKGMAGSLWSSSRGRWGAGELARVSACLSAVVVSGAGVLVRSALVLVVGVLWVV